ncbi:MAG: acylphosphatase [Patescibacteria group bacterium]|nr:acylphosphatase [Patescibacteria group bacterium]
MIKRVKIMLEGLVQGVNMRYNIKQVARDLDLKGYVRNTNDGRVEIIVVGSENKLEDFFSWLKSGRTPGQIQNIDKKYLENKKNYQNFKIKY